MSRTEKILLNLFFFFGKFYPIYPFYGLMFLEVGGLSASQVTTLFLLWYGFSFLVEIPTGIVADKFSYRDSTIMGYLCVGATFPVWFLWPSYMGYLCGFLLWGLGSALISGASTAYVYNFIEEKGLSKKYVQINGKLNSTSLLGLMFAYLLGSVLIKSGYSAVLAVTIITGSISPFLLLFFPRKSNKKKDSDIKNKKLSQLSLFKKAYQHLKANDSLFAIATYAVLLGGFYSALGEYIPLYFKWNGLQAQAISYILIAGIAVSAITSRLIHYYEHSKSSHILFLSAIASLIFYITGLFEGTIAIIGLFIATRFFNFLYLILDARIQKEIDTDERATIGSLITFMITVLSVSFFGIFWLLKKLLPEATSLYGMGLGFSLLIFGILYYFQKQKNKA